MSDKIQQPGEAPEVDGEHWWVDRQNPLSPDMMRALLDLPTEDVRLVVEGYEQLQRLAIVRDLQELRTAERSERQFEEQVQLNRERKRARHEADRLDAEERAAYLTSIDGRAEAAQQFESEIIDLDELEDPDPLIDGYLSRDTLVRTFGPPKSLKSFVTLDMAACVSLGIEWQGHRTHQTTVLYVVAEGARGVKKRRNAWNQAHETEMKVIFYPKAVQIGEQEEMYRLISYCLLKQVGYVIFDTQARCTVGVDENDNTEMGEIVAALDILKQETGACVHMVHHSTGADPRKARGATAWDGAVDAEFYTKRDRDADTVELHTKFQKDIPEAEIMKLRTLEVGPSLILERLDVAETGGTGEVAPALVTGAQVMYLETIRTFGPGGATVSDVTQDLLDRGIKRTRTAVKKAFGGLLSGGAVAQTGRGTAVIITQSGLVALDEHRRKDPQTMIE